MDHKMDITAFFFVPVMMKCSPLVRMEMTASLQILHLYCERKI